jgi:arginase
VVATCEGVRDGIEPILRAGAFPVVLGGCCSLVPGIAAALRRADPRPPGLAYVDGHMDLYDGRISPTGEAADMPVAIVAGLGDETLGSLGEPRPLVPPAGIALLAHRDAEEARGSAASCRPRPGSALTATVRRCGGSGRRAWAPRRRSG